MVARATAFLRWMLVPWRIRARHPTSRAIAADRRPVVSGLGGALATLAIIPLASCDFGSFVSEPPAAICIESGALCKLSKGPLGVCEVSVCPPGSDPPCFRCTPQH